MNMLWTFVVYNLIRFIVFLVAIVAAARISWGLGLRSDKVGEVVDHALGGLSLRSAAAQFREIHPNVPESGLTELCDLVEADQETVFRTLEKAEIKFWHRMHQLESWARVSRCLTAILVLVTLMYAISSLQRLLVGLSLEIEHNAAAIVAVLDDILHVISRNTWFVFFLFMLNTAVKARIQGRKARWNIFFNQLRRRAAREDYKPH